MGVTEPVLDNVGGDACLEQQSRVAMTEIMQPYDGDACLFRGLPEHLGYAVGVHRDTIRMREQQPVIVETSTTDQSFLRVPLP